MGELVWCSSERKMIQQQLHRRYKMSNNIVEKLHHEKTHLFTLFFIQIRRPIYNIQYLCKLKCNVLKIEYYNIQ